jgi:hypothetical protein
MGGGEDETSIELREGDIFVGVRGVFQSVSLFDPYLAHHCSLDS